MRLCITSTMDFYLDCELQTGKEITHYDILQADYFDKTVYDTFVKKLNKAFQAGNFSIRSFDVYAAEEANKAA